MRMKMMKKTSLSRFRRKQESKEESLSKKKAFRDKNIIAKVEVKNDRNLVDRSNWKYPQEIGEIL